jgi:hypothetical protein
VSTIHQVKTCSYCGREGDDTQVTCKECGTVYTDPEPEREPNPLHDVTWLRQALIFAAGACFVLFCYFASLGPVIRLFTPAPVITARTTGPGIYSVTTTKQIPVWISIVYAPALSVAGQSQFYYRYIEMWEKPAVEMAPSPTNTVITLNTN